MLVHVPDHGSETQQATYSIYRGASASGDKTVTRTINAKSHWEQQRHRWVSLGVFDFNGIPEISLSNMTRSGEGTKGWSGQHNIAWDAVAIQPLPRKPKNFVVALGDSFSSGEGAVSEYEDGTDYDRETDMSGHSEEGNQNACHRSKWAWSRKATLNDQPEWLIGGRETNLDNDLDYHMVACSGAQTENVIAYGTENAWGEGSTSQRDTTTEVPQIESGFLDQNTTLVTLSIGGNDAGWSGVVLHCLKNGNCPSTTMEGTSGPLSEVLPQRIHDQVIPSVETVLEQIHTRAPNAKIILMGYPRLISDNGDCLDVDVWIPFLNKTLGFGLSGDETAWLNDMADYFAERMDALAVSLRNLGTPVWFADPRDYYERKALCGDPPGINFAIVTFTPGENPDAELCDYVERFSWFDECPHSQWRLGLSSQSFHPNLNGTTFYANALMDVLRRPEIDQ
ncbi:SGNH/GDSL hydrolase family protein [Nonomuraea sp. NPDC049480]|uniref:SGNH/GDSL hydrolase family protein n=1 Tax=Nonomuraea sp. NPDC049480 TaxID=3364353 RepID=UPI0037A54900